MIKRMLMIFVVMFMIVSIVNAEEFSRAGQMEIFASGYCMGSDNVDLLGTGQMEIDDTFMYGMGMGYNFSDHLNMNIEIVTGSTDGTISGITGGESDVELLGMNFNLDFNILKSRFTPIISVGWGFMDFDIDDNYADSIYGGTYATANIGAGFRYDVSDNFLIKAVYRVTWVEEIDYTEDNLVLDGIHVSVGVRF